ncbi:MAG TPA: DegV family protein [Fervidobacterium sp.]|nr:DegV family protein [Fervidobacterium sp.]HOQ39547.1 DegV family protein [Fervidobacterium sp.]HPT54042.1 DegV family protein [Fervidobacterium sp.]HPZ17406.1 DegV family protein [Fervidobacterium sp.]HQE48496.1 DegV family protein [Fervidobacterium sp.]
MYTFITDSGYDLPNVPMPCNLKVLPLRVFAGEKEFEDKIDIQAEQIYEYQLSGQLPTTSLPRPDFVEKTIMEASEESEHVYILLLSSRLSNTYDIVKSIVDNMKVNNVTVLDTKSACVKQGYVILKAMEKVLKTGNLTQEDINRFSDESTLIFLVPSLEYLYKGGRIGKAKALFGKVLNVKPVLTIDEDGEVNSLATVRTIENGIKVIRESARKFLTKLGLENDYSVIGAYTTPKMKELLEKIIDGDFKDKLLGITTIGSAIAVHVGPEAFGIVVGRKLSFDF